MTTSRHITGSSDGEIAREYETNNAIARQWCSASTFCAIDEKSNYLDLQNFIPTCLVAFNCRQDCGA